MSLSDQFKKRADELAEQAKSALGDRGSKAEEAEEKARENAGGSLEEDQQEESDN
ncbi:hypothetical protein G3I19_24065 [Streptomyces sp. SID10853]|uniref:hypothetical protein n=1 Tax=Streptomyces sp. SID10853 TaxID=2706028 RepID=UPI0013BECE42|nr:hypothetical protein [Streptomyces sp. SID10853]NDZ81549.1 hypothetical protein [Streptomyces sp. SID10853]